MSRPLRLEFNGALYYITARGNERKTIYQNDDDFELFLNTLEQVCERYNWVVQEKKGSSPDESPHLG
ncbi:hypothetical protein [Pseudoalteromonas denitrificans]|uniref:hypothetical protein n=1 Tax=Pseudoalteromonas denitrificans TaxID=43656 RepID=UPI000B8655D1|nr:hypothetical protein [Pseudoalteromonas denitrificans]